MDIVHNYIEKGSGFPLIMMHGNSEDISYFEHQIDTYANYFHVYVLDTRGHGNTPRGTAPFTIRQFADDLLSFMDLHNIEKAHILGFSDGGNIAMIFAINHPERVEKLILNGSNLNTKGVVGKIQFQIEMAYYIAKIKSIWSKKARAEAEMLALMVKDPNIDISLLSKIKSRTLVLAGEEDMIKKTHSEEIAINISDSQLVIIKGDHFIANSEPEAYNEAVLSFLNS